MRTQRRGTNAAGPKECRIGILEPGVYEKRVLGNQKQILLAIAGYLGVGRRLLATGRRFGLGCGRLSLRLRT
jgi:hypothetical protein